MPELNVVNIGNVKSSLTNLSKTVIGVIVGMAGLMQIDAVKDFVTPILTAHPKIASIVAAVVAIGLLLQNPAVQKILHLNITSDAVKVSDSAGATLVTVPVPEAPTPASPVQQSTTVKLGVS
jgi:phage-related protein